MKMPLPLTVVLVLAATFIGIATGYTVGAHQVEQCQYDLKCLYASWDEQHNQMLKHAKECREAKREADELTQVLVNRAPEVAKAYFEEKIERTEREIARLQKKIGGYDEPWVFAYEVEQYPSHAFVAPNSSCGDASTGVYGHGDGSCRQVVNGVEVPANVGCKTENGLTIHTRNGVSLMPDGLPCDCGESPHPFLQFERRIEVAP